MAEHRHKRETAARRTPRAVVVAGPLALLATASAVSLGVLAHDPGPADLVATGAATDLGALAAPQEPVSRSGSRVDRHPLQREFDANMARTATLRAVRAAHTKVWTSTELNLWSGSGPEATKVGEIAPGKVVLVTGRRTADRVEVVIDDQARWVTAGYLAEEKPEPEPTSDPAAPAGLSMEPCPDPGVESGLTSNAVYVYRSVCHAFPQITSYGGWDAHGEHSSGRAIDIMTSDETLGNAIAAFLQAHAAELHLYDILWRQQIWTPVRASEGWRTFPDRGSATANHFDHVHVSTY